MSETNLDLMINGYFSKLDQDETKDGYFNSPARWAKDRLGIDFYDKQIIASDAVVQNHNVAIKAGHGVGKSFWAALLTCWWVDTRPIERVFVATTAPSAAQVTGILWREIRKAHQLSHRLYAQYLDAVRHGRDPGNLPDRPLPGYITQDNRWKDDMGNILAQGRKPPDNKSEDAFQGFHDGHVLAIGDEACGLTESMIDGLDNITTNDNSRRVLIGNPTNPLSYFAKIFRNNGAVKKETDPLDVTAAVEVTAWTLQTISVMDSPNFHGGGRCQCHKGQPLGLGMSDDALSKLTNQGYVDRKKIEYGEDSARFISRVLGEFAYDSGNNLFSEYDLSQAMDCIVWPDEDDPYLVLGVDVARMGQDSTYVYSFVRGTVQETDPELAESLGKDKFNEDGFPLRGGKLRYVSHWKKAPFVTRTMDDGTVVQGTAERINELAISFGAKEVRVDASGLGSGVIDPLFVLAAGRYIVIEIYGSAASPDRRAYHNNRSYRYSEMRRQMFQGVIDIDAEDETLIEELSGILYEFSTQSGGMLIESKDSMKKRSVSSPDAADAAWYAACELGDVTGNPFFGVEKGTIAVTDFDEFQHTPLHEYSW